MSQVEHQLRGAGDDRDDRGLATDRTDRSNVAVPHPDLVDRQRDREAAGVQQNRPLLDVERATVPDVNRIAINASQRPATVECIVVSMVDDRLPRDFHQTRLRRRPPRDFADPAELEQFWGQAWGAVDEVGPLRSVLVRTPGAEFGLVRENAYDPALDAFVDPDGRWYWTGSIPPDLRRVRTQHEGLVAALREEGVDVVIASPSRPDDIKAIYVRDPLTCVPGGIVVGRMSPEVRAGEEADIVPVVAAAGVPVLGTIGGRGTLEGGSVVKLRPGLMAVGRSIRVNQEGIDQLRGLVRPAGWEVMEIPIAGFSIHLDLHLAMIDSDLALVEPSGLPYDFLAWLEEQGFEVVWVHPDEAWGVNCLTLRPRRVLMSTDAPRTSERLEARGVEVVTVAYDELQRNGGGVHCSTMELRRDPAQ